MENIEEENCQRETVGEIEPKYIARFKDSGKLSHGENEYSHVGGDINTFEVEILEAVGGVVFCVDTFEMDKLADAGDEDKQSLEDEHSPKEVEIDEDDEVVAPTIREEHPGHSLESTCSP